MQEYRDSTLEENLNPPPPINKKNLLDRLKLLTEKKNGTLFINLLFPTNYLSVSKDILVFRVRTIYSFFENYMAYL